MTNLNKAIRAAVDAMALEAQKLRILNDGGFAKLAAQNPDCYFNFNRYKNRVELCVYLDATQLEEDISGVATEADDRGYSLTTTDKIGEVEGLDVVRHIQSSQRYTEEEKELLVEMGTLTTQVSSYTALTCNI
jgi:cysteine sulfinate desulfinase/cysteine desulfurase-like protein